MPPDLPHWEDAADCCNRLNHLHSRKGHQMDRLIQRLAPGVLVLLLGACSTPGGPNLQPLSMETNKGGLSQTGGTGQAAAPTPTPAPPSPSLASTQTPQIDVTPITAYKNTNNQDGIDIPFSDAYTRIVITSVTSEGPRSDGSSRQGEVQTMGYQERGWLERYVMGKKYDLNLTAKIRIGAYEETIPLTTLSHTSNREGESWGRNISHELSGFPWFLVKPGDAASVPNVSVEFTGSETYQSGVAATTLQAALSGIRAVAPEVTVVTTLSNAGTKDKANAIDAAISKIFSNSISERHVSDRELEKWRTSGGMEITVNAPRKDADWNGSLGRLGVWTIAFELPRVSVFSDERLCPSGSSKLLHCVNSLKTGQDEVWKKANATSILAYPLIKNAGNSTTIKTYLLQQPWFGTIQAGFSGNQASDQWLAEGLCMTVRDSITGLGLNSNDAELIKWAMIVGMQHPKAISDKAWTGSSCQTPKAPKA